MVSITYSLVEPPHWNDKPVAIVANGLSLKGFNLEALRGVAHVIAVKGAIFDLPWADLGTGIDAPRYIEWAERLGSVKMPIYWAASGMHALRHHGHVKFLHRLESDGLSQDRGSLTGGGSSGYAAINLACHKLNWEPGLIVLFGFDYDASGHVGEHNYIRKRNQRPSDWQSWAKRFNQMVPILQQFGIEVINGSADSAITAFPRCDAREALSRIEMKRAA